VVRNRNDPTRISLAPTEAADRYYRDRLTRIVSLIPERIGAARPLALLLGGSLALGEACVLSGPDGPAPGSDVDLYLVVDGTPDADLRRRVVALRDRMVEALETPGLVVDLGTITPERLRNLAPTIAHTTLTRRGRTIWGDPAILEGAARPRYDEIPGEDGYLLLLNRTVEELVELRSPGREAAPEDWYRTGKTFRDLGASALVAAGRFTPGLEEQRTEVRRLFEEGGEGPEAEGFAGEHAFWCDQKTRPDRAAAVARYGEGPAGIRRVQLVKRDALEAILRWEWRRVWRLGAGADERAAARRAARFRRRARRWAEYLLREGPGAAGPALRHLAAGLPATPLDAVYGAAIRLVLAWGPIHGAEETERDRRHLSAAYRNAVRRPERVGRFREDWIALRNETCGFWNRAVMGGTRPAREWTE